LETKIFDLIIKNGWVIDGLGHPGFPGDVGIRGDRIELIGREISLPTQRMIDARGQVVAPGFIDTHSHADTIALVDPKEDSKIQQGVTTECIGNCGLSLAPLNKEHISPLQKYVAPFLGGAHLSWDWETMGQYLDHIKGPSRNIAALVGHGTVRIAAMGPENRKPTSYEMDKMKDLVSESIDQGAFGLSSGLIYPPGVFAETDELIELCKMVCKRGGLYATHIRGESDTLVEAVNEAIQVGQKSSVSVLISHHKAGGKKNWGKVNKTLDLVETARSQGINIHLDEYPYTAGSTMLASILPPWMHDGGLNQALERLKNPQIRLRIKGEMEKGIKGWENFVEFAGWEGIVIAFCEKEKELEGKSILQIANERDREPAETAFDILLEEAGKVVMVAYAMSEDDVKTVMKHPLVMIGTDGIPTSGKPHPRAYGTYPRVLGKYVREEKIFSLEEAIRKMTSLPAQKLGLKDRGMIVEGMIADIVIFNPSTIQEKSTYLNPYEKPEGIEYVLIGGSIVLERTRLLDSQKGQVIRKA
jgi:N-acyl-D-amino-acid deacylase